MFDKGTARRVWKYTVAHPDTNGRSWVEIPVGGRVISAGLQGDEMVVWASVPAQLESIDLHRHPLLIVNTDQPFYMPPNVNFLGTFTTSNGIVWHVWSKE